jgi:hypothetical protein
MHYTLFLLLVLATRTSQAQFDLMNRTVVSHDSNFLFKNESNELVIVNYSPGNWRLTARYAEVRKTDSPWLFIVEPKETGTDTLRLLRNGVTVVQKAFQVNNVSGIVVCWGAIRKDSATVSEILANKKLIAFVPGCNCNWGIHIFSFQLELVTDVFPEWKKIHKLDGIALTPETIELIRQLKPGDKMIFKEIVAVARNGRVRVLPPFSITIK